MMREGIGQRALWAMHPAALAEFLAQDVVEGMMPEGLRSFFSMAKGAALPQPKAADPIREGATIILPVVGVLRPSYTEPLADMIRSAGADNKVGTVVLKIMSPGGLVWGTQELGDAIFDVRQSKPVIAVADKYAFSAAHWIATQATAFYATPSGQVGSVGVRGGHVDTSGFEEKIGMKTTLIASDPKKVAAHPYAPLTDEDRAEMQAEIDEMAEQFNTAIARGRGMSVKDVPAMHGTGQVFSATAAARAGITDGVMSLRDVVAKYSSPRARLDLQRKKAALQGQMAGI